MAFKAVAYQDTLQAAGVPEAQAKAHAKAMEDFVVSEMVTKDYLENTLTAKLSELKFEFVKWIIGTVGAASVTLLVAIFSGDFAVWQNVSGTPVAARSR